ncbi:MAG: trimethylamine methyltransferase family protein [Thermodesulfobacteriota bacterium]|nr:trimethylamine methyltransferase family protein [Thermodesulfobacteriota bacterium]
MANIRSNQHALLSPMARKMSEDQCRKLYWACLEILERTGVCLHEQAAVDLFEKAGAMVSDGNRVRIPAGMVEKALCTVPRKINFCDRNGNRAMQVGGHRSYFGTGSDCLHIIDHRTGQRRKAVLQDIVDGMTLCDALDHIDFVMCMFLPSDVPQEKLDRYEMEAMLNHTTKPIVYVTTEFSGCKDAVTMAGIVAGGEDQLRQRPFAACYINVTTGLRHNGEALQKLLYLSGRGLPFTYIPSAQGGVTAPMTIAGTMAVNNAGVLAGLVLSQLNNEGAPFIMPGWGGNMLDMKTTTQPYADPEKRGQAIDFAHFLGLPTFSLAGCSESKVMDQQASAEAALTLFTDALFGGNLVHDVGYLESGLSGSLPQLVICNEILSWLDAFMHPVDISDETLCLDLIDQVGPDGQYLDHPHTMEHFRERWYPGIFDRSNHASWQKKGAKSLGERATEKVDKILADHTPEPLAPDVAKAVHAVVEG